MKIAIIGTGAVGVAIARGLQKTSHEVVMGTRRPDAEDVLALCRETGAKADLPRLAADAAEMIVIALPFHAAEAAVRDLGSQSGKIVIDCMNPLGMVDGSLQLTLGHSTSGGEILQSWLPDTRVVKALNQVGAEIMAENDGLPHRPVQFMAGDDEKAKSSVAAVLGEMGFDAHDAGDLSKARILEPFAMVWINQALFQGKGRTWAFAAVDA